MRARSAGDLTTRARDVVHRSAPHRPSWNTVDQCAPNSSHYCIANTKWRCAQCRSLPIESTSGGALSRKCDTHAMRLILLTLSASGTCKEKNCVALVPPRGGTAICSNPRNVARARSETGSWSLPRGWAIHQRRTIANASPLPPPVFRTRTETWHGASLLKKYPPLMPGHNDACTPDTPSLGNGRT